MIKKVMRESNYETGKAAEANKLSATSKISVGVSDIGLVSTGMGVSAIAASIPPVTIALLSNENPDAKFERQDEILEGFSGLPLVSQISTIPLFSGAFASACASDALEDNMDIAFHEVNEGLQEFKQASARDRLKNRGINPKLTEMANSKKEQKNLEKF